MLNQLLDAVGAGRSRALVLRGEAGMGKTALLEYVTGRASGFRVARATGVQSEAELAFAGLHQLCAPVLDWRDRLPSPQRDALATIFALGSGAAPDRFMVGLAVLGLFAEAARERPLICVVDDAQWLDNASAQALAFVARRLGAESIGLIFAARTDGEISELAGLPELTVAGLGDEDARTLLDSTLRGPVDERIRARIVGDARGNPLALLELPKGLSPADLAGGFERAGATSVSGQIEQSFQRQLAPLDPGTRRLLLIAAAEPLGDPVLVWRAAQLLGAGPAEAAAAAAAGLLEIGAQVRFRHPLLRSVVRRVASAEERRDVHRALATVTDPQADPERRAWHRAHAVPGPDEDVAGDLERSAGRAQACGGMAAAAAFLERAAELTPDPGRRADRALAAAQVIQRTGASDAVLRLVALAEAGPLDPLRRAQLDLLRAQVVFTASRGREAAPLLLQAGRKLEEWDVRLARETYLEALGAAAIAGPLAADGGVLEVAKAATNAPSAPRPPRAVDLLLDGLALWWADGSVAGAPAVKDALRAFRDPGLGSEEGLCWLWFACRAAQDLWDADSWLALSAHQVQLAWDTGALTMLPFALSMRAAVHVFTGELTEAASLEEELREATEATGCAAIPFSGMLLAAWQGCEASAFELIEVGSEDAARRGEGIGLTVAGWVKALLFNSLGRYEDAFLAAEQVSGNPPKKGLANGGALVELIEAASHSGRHETVSEALEQLEESTRASGTNWAQGLEARCRALLAEGATAELAYREAIQRLGGTPFRGELARAHLLYGEWLRRQRRRMEARDQLRTAHDIFTDIGAEAFARRAARELSATGATARKRTLKPTSELTAQEAQVVRLVRDGLSNSEIALRLFLSPRTVEWHLSKIFTKLNITSRRQLRGGPDHGSTALSGSSG